MKKGKIIRSVPYYEIPRVSAVKLLGGFKVHITFKDGKEREIDLEPHIWGPVFEPIRNDPKMFAAVRVDEETDTIAWPNGADIAPETLYYEGEPPWAIKAQPRKRTPRKQNGTRPRATRRVKKTHAATR